MTTDNNTARAEWETKLERFEALRILFDADDSWGPLTMAARAVESSHDLMMRTIGEEHEDWTGRYDANVAWAQHETARHMSSIYTPLIEAGLDLVRTPAPDLAAVRVKHEACNAGGLTLTDFEEVQGELFGLIRADIHRLTGVEA